MAVDDKRAAEIAAQQAKRIEALARASFARLWQELGAEGVDVREAVQRAQASFSGAWAEALAAAFSELLQRSIGALEVRAMDVGGLSLSRRLYLHREATASECLRIVRQHARGVHQARELALALYDGYAPSEGIRRPLEGRARAELPEALRALTADAKARESLADLVERGQAQAARLKTQALRAAYAEAFDAWEEGAAEDALQRRLDVAYREKTRFMANRIAQTELARAHQADRALEVMDDEALEVVEVRINPAHPKTDICDLHARADLWGLGPGLYPKAKAPRPPFHPFCWCRIRPRFSLSAAGAREVPNGPARYLGALPPEQAARIMGSAEKAAAVITGEATAVQVINAGKDPLYRLARVGDPPGHPLVKAPEPA